MINYNYLTNSITSKTELYKWISKNTFYDVPFKVKKEFTAIPCPTAYYYNVNGFFNPLIKLNYSLDSFFNSKKDLPLFNDVCLYNDKLNEIFNYISEYNLDMAFYYGLFGCNTVTIGNWLSYFESELNEVIFTLMDNLYDFEEFNFNFDTWFEILEPLNDLIYELDKFNYIYDEYLNLNESDSLKIDEYELSNLLEHEFINIDLLYDV